MTNAASARTTTRQQIQALGAERLIEFPSLSIGSKRGHFLGLAPFQMADARQYDDAWMCGASTSGEDAVTVVPGMLIDGSERKCDTERRVFPRPCGPHYRREREK